MKKIYITSLNVFEVNSVEIGKKLVALKICLKDYR